MTSVKIIAEECPWEDEFDSDKWEDITPISLKPEVKGESTVKVPSPAVDNNDTLENVNSKDNENTQTTEKDSEEEGELELGSSDEYRQKISAKISEKANWLSQAVLNPTKDQVATPRSSKRQSKLIAERLEWIHNQVLVSATGSKSKESLLKKESRTKRTSDLVADRHRFLEEQQQRQLPLASPRNLDPALFQGLASDRSKWFQEIAIEHQKAGEAWKLLEERRKKNPKRFLVKDKHDYGSDTTTPKSKRPGNVTGTSLFESNEEKQDGWLFNRLGLVRSQRGITSTPQEHESFIAQQATSDGVVWVEDENKITLSDRIVATYHDIAIKLEQEGFLPSLLADNTTWLFGSKQGCEEVYHASVPFQPSAWVDKLRIDVDVDSDSEELFPIQTTSIETSDVEHHQEDQDTNKDAIPEHTKSGLRQRKGAKLKEERDTDGRCGSSAGGDSDAESEAALMPRSEKNLEQCCGTLRTFVCPGCEIL